MRIEPPPSLAVTIGSTPPASAAAEPPLEPPGSAAEVPRRAGVAEQQVLGDRGEAELRRVGLGDHDGAGGAQALDLRRVDGGDVVAEGDRAVRGLHAGDVLEVLDAERNAFERARLAARVARLAGTRVGEHGVAVAQCDHRVERRSGCDRCGRRRHSPARPATARGAPRRSRSSIRLQVAISRTSVPSHRRAADLAVVDREPALGLDRDADRAAVTFLAAGGLDVIRRRRFRSNSPRHAPPLRRRA